MIKVRKSDGETIEFSTAEFVNTDEHGWVFFMDEDGLSVGLIHRDKVDWIEIEKAK